MKTILHANIDGFEVVLGIGEAFGFIDPVATNIKIAPLLMACEEQKQMNALNQRIGARRQDAIQSFSQAEAARQRNDGATVARENGNYQAKLIEVAELEKQFPDLVLAFEAARAHIIETNAIYTHPPQGEDLIDDAQAADLAQKHNLRGETHQLLMTGEYIDDFRGRDFWLKDAKGWAHKQIETLGETIPEGAIAPEILTDAQRQEIADQRESDRLAALSPEDRALEADRVKAAALTQAAQMRSELEIQGDVDALKKSQAWYQDQVTSIAEKYGVK